jgi:hypothetical protein
MRASFLAALGLGLAACGTEASSPTPLPSAKRSDSGSLYYVATTPSGEPLLTGQLNITILADSTIVGTWSIQWAPGADRTIEVGDQIGLGTLEGRQSDGRLSISLNPGYRDNNVDLLGIPDGKGFSGTWVWSTFAGPRTQGRFSADSI